MPSDRYGFPRSSEVLGAVPQGAVWKCFWSLPPGDYTLGTTGGILCPYPFPGRYFRSNVGFGLNAGSGSVDDRRTMSTGAPVIRISSMTATDTSAAGVTSWFVNTRNIIGGTNIGKFSDGIADGVKADIVLTMGTQTVLRSMAWIITTPAVPVLEAAGLTTITYGGQDLWFNLQTTVTGTTTILMATIDYLDIPL